MAHSKRVRLLVIRDNQPGTPTTQLRPPEQREGIIITHSWLRAVAFGIGLLRACIVHYSLIF